MWITSPLPPSNTTLICPPTSFSWCNISVKKSKLCCILIILRPCCSEAKLNICRHALLQLKLTYMKVIWEFPWTVTQSSLTAGLQQHDGCTHSKIYEEYGSNLHGKEKLFFWVLRYFLQSIEAHCKCIICQQVVIILPNDFPFRYDTSFSTTR